MPTLPKIISERIKEDSKFIGSHGWTLLIDRRTQVGCTYRASLRSPDGRVFTCPTAFRHSKGCYAWAVAKIKKRCKRCWGTGKQTIAGDSGCSGGALCSHCGGDGFQK